MDTEYWKRGNCKDSVDDAMQSRDLNIKTNCKSRNRRRIGVENWKDTEYIFSNSLIIFYNVHRRCKRNVNQRDKNNQRQT